MSDLREKLAEYAHNVFWASWMKSFFKKCEWPGSIIMVDEKPHVVCYIPEDDYNRWKMQMNTPYKDLPEEMKVSDREQADNILNLEIIEPADQKSDEESKELGDMKVCDSCDSPASFVRRSVFSNSLSVYMCENHKQAVSMCVYEVLDVRPLPGDVNEGVLTALDFPVMEAQLFLVERQGERISYSFGIYFNYDDAEAAALRGIMSEKDDYHDFTVREIETSKDLFLGDYPELDYIFRCSRMDQSVYAIDPRSSSVGRRSLISGAVKLGFR